MLTIRKQGPACSTVLMSKSLQLITYENEAEVLCFFETRKKERKERKKERKKRKKERKKERKRIYRSIFDYLIFP